MIHPYNVCKLIAKGGNFSGKTKLLTLLSPVPINSVLIRLSIEF